MNSVDGQVHQACRRETAPSSRCSTLNTDLVGDTPNFRRAVEYARLAAATDANVLIIGETGTGKELFARLVHDASPRHANPFVSLNCAAIPEELFESELFGHEKGAFTDARSARLGRLRRAHTGTLFLDEVGDMSARCQAKLLRALDTRWVEPIGSDEGHAVDVRLVAATNRDLETLVRERAFRPDLFYRLNVARIELPPLRARRSDVATLSRHFIVELAARNGSSATEISDETLHYLECYRWPGNLRELRNAIEGALISCRAGTVEVSDLPVWLREAVDSESGPATICEEDRILAALHETNWNKSAAARRLNWSRMTLYRKLRKYCIETAQPVA